ncbi:MAG TPA: hypothetical protein VHC41_08260 [Mycobacteriales bacterium]|nr:hypothetical protein [Mycobacteriales bacterium]
MTGQHDATQGPTVPVGVSEPDWLEQSADADTDPDDVDEGSSTRDQSPGDADEPDRIEQSIAVRGDEDYPREPDGEYDGE